MGEHKRAILLIEVLVEAQPRCRAREQAGERRLAHRERLPPQVIAVQLNQIEGIEEHVRIMPPVADAIEARDAVLTARHSLAIEDAGARAQASERLDDEREAVGKVVARPAAEPHAVSALAGDYAEAVVLDLVQPVIAARRLWGRGGQARRNEACRQTTRRRKHGRRVT